MSTTVQHPSSWFSRAQFSQIWDTKDGPRTLVNMGPDDLCFRDPAAARQLAAEILAAAEAMEAVAAGADVGELDKAAQARAALAAAASPA